MQGLLNNTTRAAFSLLPLAAGLLGAAAHAATAPLPAGKADASLTRILAVHLSGGWTSVIVKTAGPLTAAQQAQSDCSGYGRDAPPVFDPFRRGAAARPQPGQLAALPFVTHLSSDGSVQKCDEFSVEASGADVAGYPVQRQRQRRHRRRRGLRHQVLLLISPARRILASVTFVPPSPTCTTLTTAATAPMSPASSAAPALLPPAAARFGRSRALPPSQLRQRQGPQHPGPGDGRARSSPASSGSSAMRPSTRSG